MSEDEMKLILSGDSPHTKVAFFWLALTLDIPLLSIPTHNAPTKYAELVLLGKLLLYFHTYRALEAAKRSLPVVRTQSYTAAPETKCPCSEHPGSNRLSFQASRPIRVAQCCRDHVIQRVVAEGVVVCNGVGRQGKKGKLPGYEHARAVLILMGVAGIAQVVTAIIRDAGGTS
ncbi:hypothetical protein AZE42_11308 [Rhizopogon vesiculosus]|uniref:Uncharacterized protein n=1 Tax=Rhizopogon vesiculosus TaxID=180088 RepID=A0A1J8Q2J7_9AGAM|nr:hypothetical protein AZE42_11308 [Rhizopogon vesiculosus]